jgi:hypothetical protein
LERRGGGGKGGRGEERGGRRGKEKMWGWERSERGEREREAEVKQWNTDEAS